MRARKRGAVEKLVSFLILDLILVAPSLPYIPCPEQMIAEVSADSVASRMQIMDEREVASQRVKHICR